MPTAMETETERDADTETPAGGAFRNRMLEALNGAALVLMTSIGHRTGLFDAMAAIPPADGGTIAREAGLSERYVREWLGAMVAAGVVVVDPELGTYSLPREHAAWLARAASPNNLAVATQWIAVVAGAEDQVVEAFGHGRGVPCSAYRRFHQVMAEDSAERIVARLLNDILPLAPHLPPLLERGADVLDVGCGAGGAAIALASAYRRSRFVGYDISPEALGAARGEASRRGLRNVRFEARDVAEPIERGAFDLVTAFDAIHDQARPARVLANVAAALRPGGTFLMVEVRASSHHHQNADHPAGTFLYAMSCMHCVPVSLAAGGPGLGAAWGEEKALDMLRAAGFRGVRVEQLPDDVLNNYYIASTESA
jgi:SAM-dependent methyltransferase